MSKVRGRYHTFAVKMLLALGAGALAFFCRPANSPPTLVAKSTGSRMQTVYARTQAASAEPIDASSAPPRDPATRLSEEELFEEARRRTAQCIEDALAWAESQPDAEDRARLLFAVVRAWAERDTIAAVGWVVSRDDPSDALIEAALIGSARKPTMALAVARLLFKADPEIGATHGLTLVGALTGAGEFGSALQFIDAAPPEQRDDWLGVTFRRWGAHDPTDAVAALGSLAEADARAAAFRALAAGWAEHMPATLAAFASALPPSTERDSALCLAVDRWAQRDPAALAQWLNTLSPGPDFDRGTAALLVHSDQANRSIEVGLQWVNSISDQQLRCESLGRVLTEWQQTQPADVRSYLQTIPWLSAEERTTLTRKLDAALNQESEE